ncbi:phosphatidylglycerol lysyltransferase domain-containing protein [Sphingobium amiense]|uniref:phosphatidylglycerol lysyltransferase domain-containing protein n=1 Tax=Sphingobium amiense TaxID=135719 RepID=UPI001E5FED8F|nr:phosphatidylglycerol lysyltransferase domain-containing protein [Sphingobium amiense]
MWRRSAGRSYHLHARHAGGQAAALCGAPRGEEGARFAIIARDELAAHLPRLQEISESWLREKGHREKGFSVGRFDPAYLARFDCAVVLREEKIVAFANVWATQDRTELSIDLMRHDADMPYGTMDYLFVRLMQWGHGQGYRWFTLGLAPLSGLEARRLAPLWARLGALLYHHGQALYGFEGLRSYKEKFSPVWEPRFIAGPQGPALARALFDLQALIGGK